MVCIQVYIPDKNSVYDFRVSTQINIVTLKSLILEAVYNLKYDLDFVKKNFLFLKHFDNKKLDDNFIIEDYAIHDGEKFLLI